MSKGFKKLHFDWRDRVLKELKGARLSVWIYHYWRSNNADQVETSNAQIARGTGLTHTTVESAKRWLKATGWLVVDKAAYRDPITQRWIVPTMKVAVPETRLDLLETRDAVNGQSVGGESGYGSSPENPGTGKSGPSVYTEFLDPDGSSVNTPCSDASRLRVDTEAEEEEEAAASAPADFETDLSDGLSEIVAVAKSYGSNGDGRTASLNVIPLLEKQHLCPADLPLIIAAARSNPDQFMANRIRTWKGLLSCLEKGGLVDQWRNPPRAKKKKSAASIPEGIKL